MTRASSTVVGSSAPTIRSLVALAEQGWAASTSQPGGAAGVPEGSPFAVTSYVRRRPCTGGLPACDPETGAGLLDAVAEPASARLLVAEPVRAAASAMSNGTARCGGAARRGQFDVSTCLACKLCGRRMNGDMTMYMYMDKGFCKPECRYEYYLEELYEQRRKLAAKVRARKRDRRHAGEALRHTGGGDRSSRRIFFVSDTDDDDSSAKLHWVDYVM